MNILKLVKTIKQNSKLISFYALVISTFVVAFVATGKNINAYSQPLPVAAVRYDSSKIYTQSEGVYDFLNRLTKETSLQLEPIKTEFEIAQVNEEKAQVASVDTTLPVGMPLNGPITSPYGDTVDRSAPHVGVDIGVSVGTPIRCTASGTVTASKYSNSYGYMVEIDHGNGYKTIYAHNSENTVDEGAYVAQGDIIALSGNTGDSTGPHLHYQMEYCGEIIDPLSN